LFFTHSAYRLEEGQGKARMACSLNLFQWDAAWGVAEIRLFTIRTAHRFAVQQEAILPVGRTMPKGVVEAKIEGFSTSFPARSL